MFCAQFSCDLLYLFFVFSFIHPVHVPIVSIVRLSVPELWMTQSNHISVTRNGHCACEVSHYLSLGGYGPRFGNP